MRRSFSFSAGTGPLALVLLSLIAPAAGAQSSVKAGAVTPVTGSVHVDVTTGDTTASTFRVFNGANTELLRVTASGKVGIGVPNPLYTLDIAGSVGVTGTDAVIRPGTNYDAHLLKFMGTRLVLGELNSRAYGFTPAAGQRTLAYLGSVFDGTELLRAEASTGASGHLVLTQPAADALELRVVTKGVPALMVNRDGRVGIGTDTPSHGTALQVHAKEYGVAMRALDPSPAATGFGPGIEFFGKYDQAGNYAQFAWLRAPKWGSVMGDKAGQFIIEIRDSAGNMVQAARFAPGDLLFKGNAHFEGNVTGTSIRANYQDVAEWVPSATDLDPGTVVVLSRDRSNAVSPATSSYDSTVAGVVSAQPGVILGEGGADKEMVATTGRVRVKVDATRGPIAIGDLLVTSDRRGYAMRSEPLDLGGVAIHRPGTIIGKALEALPGGEGEILVLLSLQ
jgi:hypothetical protein